MATAKSSVIIAGKKITPYRVSIVQRFNWHHNFQITVATEKLEGGHTTIEDSSDLVGKSIEINIKCTKEDMKFRGITTSVRIDRTYAGDSFIILEGYSPTYLMEDGPVTKSFSEEKLKAIATEIFKNYPVNLFSVENKPHFDAVIPFTVQYKETNYSYLSRLAATYGQWFYYDGWSIIYGQLPKQNVVDLVLGKDLLSFTHGINVRPAKFDYQFYNYAENRNVTASAQNYTPVGMDNFGKKALDSSDGIFPGAPVVPITDLAQDDALIKFMAEADRSSLASDMAHFEGQSSNSGLGIGSVISVKALNSVGKTKSVGFVGGFRIVSISHYLDANNDYRNQFEAIPHTVAAPPVNANMAKPTSETQVAIVKENNDPDGLGRIRVQFKWQNGEEMTPWIRQVTNHASGNRGVYFVPELEDEVQIDFEQGNPDRPYMSGAVYHSNTAPEFFDPENNLKSIKTRSGHTILLNDQAGAESITIHDINGNKIYIDTAANNMTITALEHMTLNAKNLSINVGENMDVNVGMNHDTMIGENMDVNIGQNKSLTVGENLSHNVGETITASAGSSINNSAGENMSLRASDKVNINATDIAVGAGDKMDLTSTKGTIHANNELRVQARSKTKISGAKVLINKS